MKQKMTSMGDEIKSKNEELAGLNDLKEKYDVLDQRMADLELIIQELSQTSTEESASGTKKNSTGTSTKEEESCSANSVNINTASQSDLEKIIGVGPATAQKIISARPFYSLNDLLKVSGIGEITLQKIIGQNCAFVDDSYSHYSGSGGGGNGAPPPAEPPPAEPPPPQFFPVIINEIMYDLEGSDEGREWIEIFNTAENSVDLTEWKFYESETNHNLKLIQGSITIPSGGYAVIADNDKKFLEDYSDYTGILFDSTFSLSNTGESIAIKNDDLLIDQVNYSSDWGAKGDGNSLQRIDPAGDSNNPQNWQGAFPTPGA